jgi:hypothetical protein
MEKNYIRKILVIGVLFLFLGASATLVSANPNWADNFDSYYDGQLLDGVGGDDGGWTGWADTPAAAGMVTSDQARSAPYSNQIWLNSDNVHTYEGYTIGVWNWTAWQYIPTDFSGISYIILLCGYDGGGSGTVWTVQVHFDSELDLVESEFGGQQAPIVYGQWVEFRCIIDLDTDWLQIYYDGALLAEHAYTDTVQGTGGGTLNIAAVDLFANGATPVYYDDISLTPINPIELTCDAHGPYTGEINQPVSFTGSANGGTEPYTWAWTFGDGGTATVQNPTHTYTTKGNYTVTLTVTDSVAATDTDTATATITAPVLLPVLEIGTITGGFGVKASVKNTGVAAATNVIWTIALDGKLVFVGKSSTGTIATLAVAGNQAIKSKFILGFGKTNIVVSATCDEGVSADATASGIVLGPFVIGVK